MSFRGELEVAIGAARAAGAVLCRPPEGLRHKGAVDLVTQVDLASEEVLRAAFARHTPDIPVLAEEGGGAEGIETRWIVDPLDGTTNFVHGFPHYCVSVALQIDGELAVGVIYEPLRDRLFAAAAGAGASVNGEAIRVSERASLGASLVASGFAYDRRERVDWYLGFVRAALLRARGFRRCGSAALDLAMVACGQLEGYWELGLQPWDIAAGTLLVREAGGRVSDIGGGPLDLDAPRVLASNSRIHGELASALADALARED